MSVDNVEAVVERGCGGGGGGGGKGEEAAGVTATWRHHRSISTASNMSVLLLFLLCLAPCLASAMTNPDSLTLGLQCDFERQEECGWEWQTDIPDTPFRITTGRELEQQISQQVPGERLSGVLYDASQNPDGQFLYLGVPEEGGDLLNNTRLIKSPWMEESVEECKLEADYNVKDLDTTIKVIIENGNYTRFFTIDSVRTDKASAVWKRVSSTIGHLPKKFRLGIEVLLSHRRPTHAAIDNIKLVNCFESVKPPGSPCYGLVCENGKCLNKDSFCDITKNCPGGEDEAMCDELPMGSRCNFEDGWCGWKNIEGDNMDFIRSRGPTTKERTGPGHDHTFKNDSGHYLLSELPTKGKLGDHGVLESPFFESPPCYHSNQTSPYFESCKLRLYYHKLGRYQGSLILKVFEYDMRGTREDPPHILTQIHGEKGTEWVRIVLPLPKDMYKRYKIQISNVRGSRFRGDLGIDDVTLSPECFGRNVPPEELKCPIRPTPGAPTPGPSDSPTTYVPPDGVVMVTTCGALGHKGPAPENCREEYHSNPGQAPTVPSSTSLPGTQIWKVPHDGYYTIVAKGASGGSGVQSQDLRTHGAIARATFLLTATTELYILVGQEGMSACRNVPNETREQRAMCASKKDPPVASNQSKSNLENLKMKINSHTVGGGGGGGGGSFVFMMDNGTPKALVVGGGAAGLAWAVGEGVTSIQDGQNMNTSLPESHGHALHNGALYYAGPGGGWEGIRREQEGQSLMNGGVGGRPCNYPSGFLSTFGGFGGGGGGCLAGGGGGGYTGGNAYSGPERHGEGGFSYTASIATFSDIRLGLHLGPGVVFIIPATKGDCGCDHMCMPLDEHLRERKCLCEQDQVLSDDDKTCVPASGDSYMQTLYVAFIVLGALVVALISATSIYCYNRYQRKKFDQMRREIFSDRGPELQLNQLRASTGGMVTEYNPNYEFGGGTCTIKDLKSVNRNNLTLVKALGQGAFGEVYQGYLKNYAGDSVEMPVAVKTLPEMSSNQSEMDFLMEALIMSKFAHPNIVHFIGVCFDKLPRFIVLELLSGGDLKSFLREARPKPERPSALTMRDLLTCATDVAKGCEYLEGHHFIHRDIAARNCLLTTKGPGRVVKIADFGMARDIYRNDYYRKGGKAMLPVKWMPPEAFLDGIFTSKTDVWSFGVLLWEVMSLGYMPYPGRGNQEVMQLVTNGGRLEPPTNCPGPVYRIMTQCWHPIPEERPTFTTILERLGYCIQDPDVVSHALPVFQRPPSAERDATVMRPHDSDACLTVSRRSGDPQSPASADYLIPLPSSYSLSTVRSDLNSTPSIDSGTDCCQIDRLLEAAPPPPPTWETSFTTEPPPPPLNRPKPTPTPAAPIPARPPAHTPHMAESQSTQPLLKPSPPGSPQPERLMRPGERPEPQVPPRDRPRPHHHYHPHCYNNSGSSNNSSSSNSSSSNSSHTGNTNSSASTLPLDPATLPCIPPPLQYVNVNVQSRGAEYDHEPYIIHETREHREISC